MNQGSCSRCGVVVNLEQVKFIEMYPDENEDELGDVNPNSEWNDTRPCETWDCPVCNTFNGEENA